MPSRTATEPAALAALALLGHGQFETARAPLDWLAAQQIAEGVHRRDGVAISAPLADEPVDSGLVARPSKRPHWPTNIKTRSSTRSTGR